MRQPRLIPSENGWWYVSPRKVALLPPEAAREGRLTQQAEEELIKRGFFTTAEPPFAVTVLTATSCNLGCSYCFQNTEASQTASNPFAPARIPRRLLVQEGVERIADFVQERMSAIGADRLSLVLFGGEPLLNPSACTELLRRLKPLGLSNAQMISNVVLLTPQIASELSHAGLRRIQVSFDGHRADHDRARVDHKGSGTYDRILRNITQASQASGMKWQFRVNVSHRNLKGLDRLIEDLSSLPLRQPADLDLALIDDVGVGYDNDLSYGDALADRFIELIDLAIDSGLSVPVIGTPLSSCPFCSGFAGTTGAVINADGTLYSCWETAGRAEWAVGTVSDGYLPDDQIKNKWVACDYAAESHGSSEKAKRFFQKIDSHILNRTYSPGIRQ
ncbi:radical SAM protein [Streptomyces sp. NRRL S-1521]|uniref:radical SAM protein n=1 Tax=Streptomyces sp. NRRL S-1521 TaxID=1609100 RepID=UPI0007497695|nr:radical SAM protein [Streptomyces sp. NRRL S-1521]KUL53267.1 hypothetical protein ADL30_20430 [Streptomyces sp. NRRL S-1521]